jgi:hypothetical protein
MPVVVTLTQVPEDSPRQARRGSAHLKERIIRAMTKTLDVIKDVIRNPKHPFRQLANRPDKPHKNRYERRKIRQFLHQGDWVAEEQAT